MKKAISILLTAAVLMMPVFVFAACGDPETADDATTDAATTDAAATDAATTENGTEADTKATTEAVTEAPTEKPTTDPALAPEEGKVKVTKWYPASSLSEGIAAPANGTLLIGDLIGASEGWNANPDVGNAAAFDGDTFTFFDPAAPADPTAAACGLKTDKEYILTEIRICPRDGFIARFRGASIWGTNEDVFDPATATRIWESDAEASEAVFQVITADKFIEGANTGFTHFIYFNNAVDDAGANIHGDVAEIELYGTAK